MRIKVMSAWGVEYVSLYVDNFDIDSAHGRHQFMLAMVGAVVSARAKQDEEVKAFMDSVYATAVYPCPFCSADVPCYTGICPNCGKTADDVDNWIKEERS